MDMYSYIGAGICALLLRHVFWDVFPGACSCTSLVRDVFGLWHYFFFLSRLAPTQGRVCEGKRKQMKMGPA